MDKSLKTMHKKNEADLIEMTYLAHKIELRPNNKQKTYFKKACGVSRFAWNWGLSRWNDLYRAKQEVPKEVADTISISGMSLKKDFNAVKKNKYPWTSEVTKYAAQQPFIHLQKAWNRFFTVKGTGKPKFKKKGRCSDSFYIGGDQVRIKEKKIWIPSLGLVRMKENIRFDGKIKSVTISRQADKWFASIQIATRKNLYKKCSSKKKVGLDIGINKMIVLSNGIALDSPKPLRSNLKKLAKEQKMLSRKIRAAKRDGRELKDSKNFQKQKVKVQKIHMKVRNIRKDTIQKITTYVTSNFKEISIEDLHVKEMLKNHKLSRAISDVGFGEVRRQLEYKSKIRGNYLYVADRFFPSSKMCSNCEKKKDFKLSDRKYVCSCGLKIDRDLNAAINLENELRIRKIRPVRSKFKPVEVTAMQKSVFPIKVTRTAEAGSKFQVA